MITDQLKPSCTWPSVKSKLQATYPHSLSSWPSRVWLTVMEEVRTSAPLIYKARFSPFFPTLLSFSPFEPATPDDATRTTGLGSKSGMPQRASGSARCPPSVCVTCQMPCHRRRISLSCIGLFVALCQC